jgi:hypothetical protein
MIDKIIYSFFGLLDKFSEHLDNVTRIFVQKIICFCLAMANKINNELGEKICTKK